MRRTRPADMVSETSTCSSHLVQITLASDSSRTSLGTSVLPSSAMAMATPLRTWEYSALTQYYRTTVFTQMALLYCTLYEFISNMASRSEFFFSTKPRFAYNFERWYQLEWIDIKLKQFWSCKSQLFFAIPFLLLHVHLYGRKEPGSTGNVFIWNMETN